MRHFRKSSGDAASNGFRAGFMQGLAGSFSVFSNIKPVYTPRFKSYVYRDLHDDMRMVGGDLENAMEKYRLLHNPRI